MLKKFTFSVIPWLLLLALMLALALNKNSRSKYFTYQSEIWADKACYYVYLPAFFIYDMDPHRFPEGMDNKTGNCFILDTANNKVFTKVSYGVALLETPFFLAAHALAKPLGYSADGFSPVYQKSITVAAAFYLLLGLFFLSRFLRHYFPSKIVFASMAVMLLGTNLFYYSVVETGMSHVYSFAAFSAFLYFLRKVAVPDKFAIAHVVGFAAAATIIVLIRPLNIIFLSFFFVFEVNSLTALVQRLKLLINPRFIFPAIVVAIILAAPQVAYWYYLTGKPLMYSYGDESFIYLLEPRIPEVLFAAENGLFPYNPIYIFVVAGLVYMALKKKVTAWYLIALFFGIAYIYGSWWAWNLGCSYGMRAYSDYAAIFVFGMAWYLSVLQKGPAWIKITSYIVIALFIAFNLKMIYSYDRCFYGSPWEWEEYFKLVFKKT